MRVHLNDGVYAQNARKFRFNLQKKKKHMGTKKKLTTNKERF